MIGTLQCEHKHHLCHPVKLPLGGVRCLSQLSVLHSRGCDKTAAINMILSGRKKGGKEGRRADRGVGFLDAKWRWPKSGSICECVFLRRVVAFSKQRFYSKGSLLRSLADLVSVLG